MGVCLLTKPMFLKPSACFTSSSKLNWIHWRGSKRRILAFNLKIELHGRTLKIPHGLLASVPVFLLAAQNQSLKLPIEYDLNHYLLIKEWREVLSAKFLFHTSNNLQSYLIWGLLRTHKLSWLYRGCWSLKEKKILRFLRNCLRCQRTE